ncbi:M15 family metallopeptidase, partial [Candidatus Nomurabacteria bacterium]|nr:M15 family metallopeptidase [Candidatus Nomurabacteria bacterium]
AKLGESFAGLALALAAYLLLNTINPRLVSQSIEVEGVNVGVDNEIEFTPIGDNSNTTLPRGGTSLCPEGVIRVEGTTFVACRPIAANIKRMVEDARRVGISLSGGGYRSVDSQIALRKQNCGSSSYDIYQKPSNRCRPPTARPGASMHQSGKAFDIICNGVGFINVANRPNTRTCFDWLRTNASRYGLYNLPSENWHWSTTGR